jgi:D-arabinan exo alpha-(1,3)/(1,5)-arabinofuranosidase (non-reducing end)
MKRSNIPVLALLGIFLLTTPGWSRFLDALTRYEEGKSMRETSARWKSDMYAGGNNSDNIGSVTPGSTLVIADLKGPGVITHMWFTMIEGPHRWAPNGAANMQEVLIRIYWDDREQPDVEAPFGDFFANCFGKRMEVISLPVVVEDGDSYNSFWQMPFRKAARVEIVNQSDKPMRLLYYNIDWIKKEKLAENTMYFCARYNQEYPARTGKDYLVLDTEGKGYYVGTVYAVRTRSPSWFGEGDLKVYLNGEKEPSIRGTGTEDYFLSAWMLKPNSTPYFGVPYLNRNNRIIGQETCSYRWHIQDPLVFNEGIKLTFETFGWISADETPKRRANSWNERQDDFSSVAYWYQMGPSKQFAKSTTAKERALPSLDRITLAGKDCIDTAKRGKGRVKYQSGKLTNRLGGQMLFKPSSIEEGWLEFSFEVKEREPLRLALLLTRSYDFGKYQPILNGVKIGKPLDLYQPDTDVWDFQLMDFWPDPGQYTLRLECVGKNEASKGHNIGVIAMHLIERRPRVKELAFDKNKDWRQEQLFYR